METIKNGKTYDTINEIIMDKDLTIREKSAHIKVLALREEYKKRVARLQKLSEEIAEIINELEEQ